MRDELLIQTLSEMKEDIRDISKRMDELGMWQAKVVGGSIVLSTLVAVFFGLAELAFKK